MDPDPTNNVGMWIRHADFIIKKNLDPDTRGGNNAGPEAQ